MPTGYTHEIYEGKDVSFPEFAMGCARNFGALITMRDEPRDAPIPDEFQPSDYHPKAIVKAQERLTEVEAWSDEQAEIEASKSYEAAARRVEEDREKRLAMRRRYLDMLKEVHAWTPPTPDHEGLKEFMVEQLKGSIDFDTSLAYQHVPKKLDGTTYRKAEIDKAKHDISYHQSEYEKEVERCRGRSEWVKALRASLEGLSVGR